MKTEYNYNYKCEGLLVQAVIFALATLANYFWLSHWLGDPIKALWIWPAMAALIAATLYLGRNRLMAGMAVRDWLRIRRRARKAWRG